MNNPDQSFSVKDIEADPQLCCTQRWADGETSRDMLSRVAPLLAKLDELKSELKTGKADKQTCAREFGQAKSAGVDLAPLKARMQEVSQRLAELEETRKHTEETLLALFAAAPVDAPLALPARFNPPLDVWHGEVQIALADGNDAEHWDAYVAAHTRASLYHLYRWRQIIHDSFGHNSYYLIARDAMQQVRGVLPLIQLDSPLFGNFAVSVPFFNYGGVVSDSSAIASQLLAHAAAIAKAKDMDHLEIRETQPLPEWPSRTDKVSMILALPGSEIDLETQLGSKLRAQIKRAYQENISVTIGHLELLDDFYDVFAENMRDLGTPVYGKAFFANILRGLPQQSHLICVYLDGKPVSCAFLLGYREMMEIPWASTLRTANAASINMALYRAVLGFCIGQKYRFFDFGRSTKDAGTYRFKKQWGAQPVQHYWHYWLKTEGELPQLKPSSPKFRLMIAVWQRLPVFVSKLIGPHVVKYLP